MYILGVNSAYHESSACLLADGAIVATAEEERFNRIKHGKQARADNPDELPMAAVRFCLDSAGITMADVDVVTVAAEPQEMERVLREGLPSAWNDPRDQERFLAALPNIARKFAAHGFGGDLRWVPHHTAHAASAFFASPFADAGVLVVDALGDDAYSTRLYHGQDTQLQVVQSVRYPASIGYLWETISVFLGFGVYDAAKVMGLAAYGDPARFSPVLGGLAWPLADGGFDMAHDALRFSEIMYYPPAAYHDQLAKLFGTAPRRADEPLLDIHHDIAAALQAKTDALVLHLAGHLHALTGSPKLCLAGGVALNCVTNEHVYATGPYDGLWVQPAAHDGGLALGGALYAWNHLLGRPRGAEMTHAYWGPSFTQAQIEAELNRRGIAYQRPDDFERAVAQLVSEEKVVGLFQGAMELGPRALGNRSIIADPRHRHMRDVLNRKIKHREYFRPLAPSVLHEDCAEWFEIAKPTRAADFMLMAYQARPDKRDQMGAVLHADGSCRIQVVRQETNPRFHRVIAEFKKITGVPMVLNTSFNDQEPIICSPKDAVSTFIKTEMDCLAIWPFLVMKEPGLPGAVARHAGAQ